MCFGWWVIITHVISCLLNSEEDQSASVSSPILSLLRQPLLMFCFAELFFVAVLITYSRSLCRASAGRVNRGEEEDGCGSVQSALTETGRSRHCPSKCSHSVETRFKISF